MCTVVIQRRSGHIWPVIIGANRDEMKSRSWRAPGRHWPDRPDVVAGYDEQAGGSWMGLNDYGLVAAILNRAGSLGTQVGKRSRGELVLDALDHADAATAAAALVALDPEAYRPFNLIIADNTDGFWIAHRGTGALSATAVPEGVSMITEGDMNDPSSSRVRRYLPRFRATAPEDPGWQDWARLLSDTSEETGEEFSGAMCFDRGNGFATVSHSLIALPAPGIATPPVWRFAAATDQSSAWESIETR